MARRRGDRRRGREIALARGACTGLSMILTSMAVKTASKVAVNLVPEQGG
jgi:hypothetical protein